MPFIHFESSIGIMATEDIAANSTLMEIPLDEVMLFFPHGVDFQLSKHCTEESV